MGFKRFLKRRIGPVWTVDAIKNIKNEGSIKSGLSRTIKEDLCEDNPITGKLYNVGRFDGRIEGYVEASNEYESKLLEQADEFLEQKKLFIIERDAYEKLLDEYEVVISDLINKVDRTEYENNLLHQLLIKERELRKMGK